MVLRGVQVTKLSSSRQKWVEAAGEAAEEEEEEEQEVALVRQEVRMDNKVEEARMDTTHTKGRSLT